MGIKNPKYVQDDSSNVQLHHMGGDGNDFTEVGVLK
jgi:hypothetical protein